MGKLEAVRLEAPCAHAREVRIRAVQRPADGCQDCLAMGGRWVHLRTCLTCGQVGCCDSSPNRHATKHFQATGHPIVTSAELGEAWIYCYVDQAEL